MKSFSFKWFCILLLLRPTEAYSQWEIRNNGVPSITGISWAIDACDSNNVVISFAVSPDSQLFKSTNGGLNWFPLSNTPVDNGGIIDISMPDPNKLWIATGSGKIYFSSDAGYSWQLQFFDTTVCSFMNYIEMFDVNNGVAMGDPPLLPFQNKPALFLTTTNGGQNWIAAADTILKNVWSGDTWRRMDFTDINNGYFYVSGINPQKIYKTTDGGENWLAISPAINSLYNLKFYNPEIGIAAAGDFIYRTTNGGGDWEIFNLNTGWGEDFEFLPGNPGKIWFAESSSLFFSGDTGRTWTTQQLPVDSFDTRDIEFVDEKHGWLLCDDGIILYTSNGDEVASSVEENDLALKVFVLNQNYPNPFNPSTTIKFTVSPNVKGEMSNVILKVYDILGSEIETLVNEEKLSGNYQVTFDASKLASGVYFYRMQAGSYSQTKKMILVK
ncbi:MAG: T9SS type A sorting domain-containing protein [Ignavibacteriaceae bacterium]|nr:T9SS type A sorting domain-containing protein [Ignavibacteriaceae bacterium]